VNYGLALALFLLAVALIVIGWRGTYAQAWMVLTGRQTTFGGAQGGTVADPVATGAQAAQSGLQATGAGAAPIAAQVTKALAGMGFQPLAPAPQQSTAGALVGFQP
jgi:hypothetical protein